MPLFTAKSVDQIQQEYFQALAEAGTGLRFDTTQGSVITALARGSAAVAAGQYRDLVRLAASMTLAGSVGEDLDAYSSFGVTRRQPTKAIGTVLALSLETPVTVAPGSVLIDPATTLQFETLNTLDVTVSYLETPILVRSLLATPLANLAPGTRLYSQSLTTTSFVVGTSRAADGTYRGALTGGTNLETDEQYRERIGNWLASHTTASNTSVVDRLLSFPGVTRAFTVTNSGGVLEIWVDSPSVNFSASQKAEIASYVKNYVADGVVVAVSQIERTPVNLLLEVTPFSDVTNASLNYLSNRIREVIAAYMQRLTLGQNVSVAQLLSAIKPLATQVKIKSPGRDIFVKSNQLAVLGDLQITYPA